MENRFLARKILCVVLFRECNDNIFLFARCHTDQLFFKARNEHAGAERQLLSFRGAALELLLTYKAGVVQKYCVSFLRGSFHQDRARVSLLQRFDFIVDILVLDFLRNLFDFHALVVFHFYDWEARNCNGDGEAFPLRDLAEFRGRRVDDLKV